MVAHDDAFSKAAWRQVGESVTLFTACCQPGRLCCVTEVPVSEFLLVVSRALLEVLWHRKYLLVFCRSVQTVLLTKKSSLLRYEAAMVIT